MKLKLRLLIFFLLVIVTNSVFSQQVNYSSTSKKAIKNYKKALEALNAHFEDKGELYLKKAIKADPNFIEAYTVLGDMYSNNRKSTEAIENYKKALAINPDFFPNNYNSLGEELLKLAQYDEAALNFKAFLKSEIKLPQLKRKAIRNLRNAEFAVWAIAHPVEFNPQNLGSGVNTRFQEYLPALTADGQSLIVTVLMPDDTTKETMNLREKHEDFYSSEFINGIWTNRKNIGPPINTNGNEGAQCISPDGQFLFFTSCDEGMGEYSGGRKGYGSCDIFYSQKIGDTWSKPQNMGKPINSQYWDTQPSISSDGNDLYFVSKRNGGKGGSDIWKSSLTKEGYWGIPVNLGDSVNTEYDEASPFIHPDNQTLYFSSFGHTGMGSSDLFITRKNKDGQFVTAKNLGYPINTSNNESSLIVNAAGTKAYYSSIRQGGFGMEDIYSFDLPKAVQPQPTSYFKGRVFDKNSGKGIEARFELTDLETGKLVAESYSNSGNGDFLICLPTNKNYMMTISKNGYLFYSDNFQMKGDNISVEQPFIKDVPLIPIKAGEKVVLKNIFFNTGSFELQDESKNELQKLVAFLSKNPSLKIEISGHTDNVGSKEKNQLLSENRAKAVVDFLLTQQIDSMRLSYKGYGDTQPINENDSEEHRANNRRTEFKIIE